MESRSVSEERTGTGRPSHEPSRRDLLRLTLAAGCWTALPTAARGQSRHVAWLTEIQQPPATGVTAEPPLAPLELPGQPLVDLAAWRRRREELRAWWCDFLGIEPKPRPAPEFEVLEDSRVDGVVRQLIRYEAAPQWPTEAYLLWPEKLAERTPGVVVFHSTVDHSIRQPAGVEGEPAKAFGWQLARLGYVVLCPRNFLWSANDRMSTDDLTARFLREHPRQKGMARMLSDAMQAVDLLTSLPTVDARRIATVGHSLGAKEVLYLAAFDPRVGVSVSSEGGIGRTFSNWEDDWYLGPTIRQPEFTHDHHELLAMVAPRPFLLVGGDSADGDRSWPFVAAALPIYRFECGIGRPPLGLFNHRQGHAVPEVARQRIVEWVQAYT